MSDLIAPTTDAMTLYVQGKLEGEALEAFEAYYFEHPEILDDIAIEQSLSRGVQQELKPSDLKPVSSLGSRVYAWFGSPALGITATAAALVLGLTLTLRNYEADAPNLSTLIASSTALEAVRGQSSEDPVATIVVPQRDGMVQISLDWPAGGAPVVRIIPDSGEPEMVIRDAAVDDLGILSLILPANALLKGVYTVSVGLPGTVGDTYRFKIERVPVISAG